MRSIPYEWYVLPFSSLYLTISEYRVSVSLTKSESPYAESESLLSRPGYSPSSSGSLLRGDGIVGGVPLELPGFSLFSVCLMTDDHSGLQGVPQLF